MEHVSAQQLFDQGCAFLEGRDRKGNAHPLDYDKAEHLLNLVLNHNPGNPLVLNMLAAVHINKQHPGLAQQLLAHVCQTNPNYGEAWNNLAIACRLAQDWDRAQKCGMKAAELSDSAITWSNLSGLHINRGTPEKALEYADKSLAKDPNHVQAQWHKGIALLEMQRWSEAWEYHEARLRKGANEEVAERNYHGPDGTTPWWDGSDDPGLLVVHGEQGMGDEIMFASCIPELLWEWRDSKKVIEPSPRLERLFRRSFPDALVYGTDDTDGRRWVGELGRPDHKIAIGSLPKIYRPDVSMFPVTPYLIADPEKTAHWRRVLDDLGPEPKIGIAWQGGVEATRVDARSFHPRMFAPLFKHKASFISLQYDTTARQNVADVKNELGVTIHHYPEAVEARNPQTGQPSDIDDLAALINELDLVITIPQTCYHVAGGLGVPTWVLTPNEPDWRLGVEGDTNPWYGCVKLIRQPMEDGRDWAPTIARTAEMLGEWLKTATPKRDPNAQCGSCGCGPHEEHGDHCVTKAVA